MAESEAVEGQPLVGFRKPAIAGVVDMVRRSDQAQKQLLAAVAVARMESVEVSDFVAGVAGGMRRRVAAEGKCWEVVRCTTPTCIQAAGRHCTQVGSNRILEGH